MHKDIWLLVDSCEILRISELCRNGACHEHVPESLYYESRWRLLIKHLPEAGGASPIYVIIAVMKRDNPEFAYRQNSAAESSTLSIQKDIDI